MKTRCLPWCAACLLLLGLLDPPSVHGTTNEAIIFATGFEATEGYDTNYTLIGQNRWIGEGTGGNGLVVNYFPGLGQQAFLGYSPPTDTNDFTNIWWPLNYVPDADHPPQVQFSVLMVIIDSTNRFYDDFRWTAYNTNGQRLFTVDFDNSALLVSYALDDGAGFVSTSVPFTNNTAYTLTVNMDFARNTWNASLDDRLLGPLRPITTKGASLNLGDIDAVWAIRTHNSPGNNYLLFDNYRVMASNVAPPLFPVRLNPVARLPDGRFLLHLQGEPNRSYAIEATTNLVDWSALKTNSTASDGAFDFIDPTASFFHLSFYRARRIGP